VGASFFRSFVLSPEQPTNRLKVTRKDERCPTSRASISPLNRALVDAVAPAAVASTSAELTAASSPRWED